MPKAAGALLPDNSKISAQWTRRMNATKLWLTLKVHGRKAYEEHIDRQMKLALSFADWVNKSEHFELSASMVVPILNLRLKGVADTKQRAALHNAIVDEVTRDGRRWISRNHRRRRECGSRDGYQLPDGGAASHRASGSNGCSGRQGSAATGKRANEKLKRARRRFRQNSKALSTQRPRGATIALP